jgi:hypothetical protein
MPPLKNIADPQCKFATSHGGEPPCCDLLWAEALSHQDGRAEMRPGRLEVLRAQAAQAGTKVATACLVGRMGHECYDEENKRKRK